MTEPQAESPPKRSSAPWKPRSSRLEIRSPLPGKRYKWASVAATEARIDELRDEGWVPATRVAGGGKGREGDASPTSLSQIGTLRLMMMDEGTAQERDAYYQDQADKQTMRPAQRAMQMLDAAGGPYDPSSVLSEQIINPSTGRPFDDPRQARAFAAARIKAQRYPTAARRSRAPQFNSPR